MKQTLAKRYDLIQPIGSGGTAIVYKARDTVLHRFVAIKMLRPQHAHDADFVQRFRREAQATALLSHPNIVSVYDVGQEDDDHYIVMEYVDGETLSDIIKKRAPLPVAEAIYIAKRIAEALSLAHENGIIHRDIKPHNVLIGQNGAVKVTDFGIARDVSSSTITIAGSVMGSVHYFSPEHAKGLTTGKQSDVYSLGIVLYQMVTGQLPFNGDSPVSIALKHLQQPIVPPRESVETLPQSVENIILRALRKRLDERYADAQTMLEDLKTCLSPHRLDEPQEVHGAWDGLDEEATRAMPALTIGKAYTQMTENETTGVVNRRKKRWLWTILITLGIVGILTGGVMIPNMVTTKTVTVPIVAGLPMERAIAELEQVGLAVSQPLLYEYNRKVPENYVIAQTLAGESARVLTPIALTVSRGIERIPFPTFVGKTEEEARATIDQLGILSTRVEWTHEYDEGETGQIIRQFPAADQPIDPQTEVIRMVVSRGRENVVMPQLIGLSQPEAEALLQREGLTVAPDHFIFEEAYAPVGKVFKQYPYVAGESVKPDASTLLVYVSKGLPKEARTVTYTLTVAPEVEGTASMVGIFLTDAFGQRQQKVQEKIVTTRTFSFEMTTSPTVDAKVTLERDEQVIAEYTWSHEAIKRNKAPRDDATVPIPDVPETVVVPDETVQPVQTPVEDVPSEQTTDGSP